MSVFDQCRHRGLNGSLAGQAELRQLRALPKTTSDLQHHLVSDGASIFVENAATITLAGTPGFTSAFAAAQYSGSNIVMDFIPTFSGTVATGPRYSAFLNAVINTGGGGANFFPGNSAGSTSTGGQYN